MAHHRIQMAPKPFTEEVDGYLTGSFDVFDGEKKIATCVMAVRKGSSQFEIAWTIGSIDSPKKLGFSDAQEQHLYGPFAAGFLQLSHLALAASLGGSGLDSTASAFLAITEDKDSDDRD